MKQFLYSLILGVFASLLVVPASAQTFFCDTNGGTSSGQDCVNSIQTAVPFLRIVPDARSGAMGDVGLAISPDANSIHFNASKLAFVEEDLGLSATYTPWLRALGLQDVYLAYLSGYKRLSELETVAFGLRYFSLGNINFTDNNGMPIGTGRPNEFEITVGYARQLTPNFAVAINPKFIYSNLASNQTVNNVEIVPGIAGAADVSLTYRTQINATASPSNLTLAAAVTNLGTKISYTRSVNRDFLPANLGLGAAWELNFDEFNSITFALDINKLLVPTPDSTGDWRDRSMFGGVISSFGDAPGGAAEEFRELMYSVGVEYWYDKQFSVRAGYYTEDKTKGNRKFFTVGLGLKYNIFGLNFSYLVPTTNQRNPLDNTLRFSLLFDFGAFAGEE